MSDWNKQIIEEFQANDGKVGGNFGSVTLLLLHTTGARSGQERVNPLVTIKDGDRLVVAASKGGAPTNPDWYYNVLADPEVTVEYGSEEFPAVATVIMEEPERTELYSKLEEVMGGFTEYIETAGDRVIPIVTLAKAG